MMKSRQKMLILFMILNSRMCICVFFFSTHCFSSCGVAERFERREAARRRENPIYWQGR